MLCYVNLVVECCTYNILADVFYICECRFVELVCLTSFTPNIQKSPYINAPIISTYIANDAQARVSCKCLQTTPITNTIKQSFSITKISIYCAKYVLFQNSRINRCVGIIYWISIISGPSNLLHEQNPGSSTVSTQIKKTQVIKDTLSLNIVKYHISIIYKDSLNNCSYL